MKDILVVISLDETFIFIFLHNRDMLLPKLKPPIQILELGHTDQIVLKIGNVSPIRDKEIFVGSDVITLNLGV